MTFESNRIGTAYSNLIESRSFAGLCENVSIMSLLSSSVKLNYRRYENNLHVADNIVRLQQLLKATVEVDFGEVCMQVSQLRISASLFLKSVSK